jgi:hypothetical protein
LTTQGPHALQFLRAVPPLVFHRANDVQNEQSVQQIGRIGMECHGAVEDCQARSGVQVHQERKIASPSTVMPIDLWVVMSIFHAD